MATKTATGSVLQHHEGNNSNWSTAGWKDMSTAPWNSGQYSSLTSTTYRHRVCIKVKMPTFSGTATNVRLTFYGKKSSSTAGTTYANIHSSFNEFNRADYGNTDSVYETYAVSGSSTGSLSYNSTSWGQRTIDIPVNGNITSGGTYYIYLYTNSSGVVYRIGEGSSYYSLTLTYNEPEKYTITFDPNGGTVSPTSAVHTNGGSTNLPTPSRTGYTFVNWVDNPTGAYSREYYSPFAEDLSGNITMYAWWDTNVYYIKYDGNGSTSGSMSNSTCYYDGYYNLTSNAYSKTGHTFQGWSTSSTATTATYTNGQQIYNLSSTNGATVTLYAVWKANTYAISYNANGHGTAPSSQTKTYGKTLQLRSFISEVKETGYTISYNANGGNSTPESHTNENVWTQTSWNTKADGSGTSYASGANYTSNAKATLYAIWSSEYSILYLKDGITRNQGTATRTVTFNANGGTCSTASLNSTATINYTFAGWLADNKGNLIAPGTGYRPSSGDVTMYASWNSTTGTYKAITLPTPTRTGYTFQGWATSSSATSGTTGSYTPSQNITLYATWKINTWTVNYNANGRGTAPASQTKTYGIDLTLQSFIGQQTATGYKVSFNANGGSSAPGALTSTIYYDQTYWNTNSSGTGTNYASKGTYSTNAAARMYAIWKATNGSIILPAAISHADGTSAGYKVTFNANGGSCNTTTLTATNTIKYTFNKWAAGSTSGTAYDAKISYTPTGAVTMYATWKTSTVLGSIDLPTPTRPGYVFAGWATSSTATSGFTGSYTPSGNVTLYATWKANGAVQIGTGTGHQMALVYIHNGTEYVLAIPYVHDGTEWKMAIGG